MKKSKKMIAVCMLMCSALCSSCSITFNEPVNDWTSIFGDDSFTKIDDNSNKDNNTGKTDDNDDSWNSTYSDKLDNISIDSSITLSVGGTKQLNVVFTPFNSNKKTVLWSSSDSEVASVSDNGLVTAKKKGNATITVTSSFDPSISSSCVVTVKDGNYYTASTKMDSRYIDLYNHYYYSSDCIDSLLDANVLVIPVMFTDSTKLTDLNTTAKQNKVRMDIYEAFFGTNESTGWRSVKSYYAQESYGKFNLNGVVTDWWKCGNASSYYNNSDRTCQLVKDAVTWYKNNYSNDLTSFDADKNGTIDSVILIYGAQDSSVNSRASDNLWAYCYGVQEESLINKYNPGPNAFMWASYDFMYEDNRYCSIDAHTYIHEFGHLLGLEDYYDYSGKNCSSGCFSMQDYNVGSHDPYSVMALGWTNPYIPTSSCTIELKPFTQSGDLILLNADGSNHTFDDYLLLEYYTPTGNNEFDTAHAYKKTYPAGTKEKGIRLWHVDARLLDMSKHISSSNVTNTIGSGMYLHATSNTTYGEGSNDYASPLCDYDSKYKNYKLLSLIQADGGTSFSVKNSFKGTDLFTPSYGTFTFGSSCSAQFAYKGIGSTYKLNNGKTLPYSFSITSMTNECATIEITKNK